MKKFPLGTAKRWEVIADELGTSRTGDEVAAFVKTRLASAPMKEGDDFQNFLASRKGTGEVLAEGGASTRESSFSDVQLDLWSSEEDLKLVAAMKAHPKGEAKSADAARWAAIAADVGGHTPAQCVKRVAALKAKLAK
jgi:Myb-like DNA-binding domain